MSQTFTDEEVMRLAENLEDYRLRGDRYRLAWLSASRRARQAKAALPDLFDPATQALLDRVTKPYAEEIAACHDAIQDLESRRDAALEVAAHKVEMTAHELRATSGLPADHAGVYLHAASIVRSFIKEDQS